MTLLRFQRLGIVLLAFLFSELHAQAPAFISIEKYRGYRQVSATNLRPAGGLFGVYVYYNGSAPAGASLALLDPTGGSVPLRMAEDGTYYYEREFDSFDGLERSYPNGNYTLTQTAGGKTTPIPFVVATETPIEPTRLVNFDALQAWSDPSDPMIRWEQIPYASSPDLLRISLYERDGTAIVDSTSADLAKATAFSAKNVPFFEQIDGSLLYFRYTLDKALDGITEVASGSGFGLFFKMQRVKPMPVITHQPESAVSRLGDTVLFTTGIEINDSATFRLLKNGRAVDVTPTLQRLAPNYTAEFKLPIQKPDDAGVYFVEVSNGVDVVLSKPVQIAIMPQLDVTTLAGTSERGAENGTGRDARFNGLSGIVVLPNGDIVVSDTGNQVLRRVTPSGVVTTFAGAFGQPGSSNGDVMSARFNAPTALAIDGSGNIFVAERDNYVIRKITPAGIVTTYAGQVGQWLPTDGPRGTFYKFGGLAVDPVGNVYASDPDVLIIRKILPDGTVSTLAGLSKFGNAVNNEAVDGTGSNARFNSPQGLACDAAGNLYVGDGYCMRRITPSGVVTTISSTGGHPVSVNTTYGDGVPPSIIDYGGWTDYIAVDRNGIFYLTAERIAIRRMIPGAEAVTMAGRSGQLGTDGTNDGIGPNAQFRGLGGIAVAPDGIVYVLDGGTRIRRGALTEGSGNPMITMETQPQPQTVAQGSSVAFNAGASGPGLSYQWFKDGIGLGGATDSILWLKTTKANDAGTYSVVVGNGVGAVSSKSMPLTLTNSQDVGRLVNLSVRTRAGAEDNVIIGFVVGGSSTGTKNLLLRGIGPSLGNFGVSDVLRDPRLTLMRNDTTLATNDDWGGSAALSASFTVAGAFPLPSSSLDSALMYSANPSAYTLLLTGAGAKSGAALIEVYDQGSSSAMDSPRLVNLSARTIIGAGSGALTAGFVVGGSTSRSFLIRALGPSLLLPGSAASAQLRVYKGTTLLASNENWGRNRNLLDAFLAAGAFQISREDAALAVTLAPGAYTAEMRSDGVAGIALLELYELP